MSAAGTVPIWSTLWMLHLPAVRIHTDDLAAAVEMHAGVAGELKIVLDMVTPAPISSMVGCAPQHGDIAEHLVNILTIADYVQVQPEGSPGV